MSQLNKKNWKEEHLDKRHRMNYEWCPLCLARQEGENNPLLNIVPPQQDDSQVGMDYLSSDYRPETKYSDVIVNVDEFVDEKLTPYGSE